MGTERRFIIDPHNRLSRAQRADFFRKFVDQHRSMIEREEIVQNRQFFVISLIAGLCVSLGASWQTQPTANPAEAHAFGGNSGSPMIVDVNKFKSSIGYDFWLFGVVTGEIQETEDLTLKVTTTYKGTVSANSNVSVIVPAFEVNNLLKSPLFQQARDAYVASHPAAPPANQQPAK
jgi:hypothetical protein